MVVVYIITGDDAISVFSASQSSSSRGKKEFLFEEFDTKCQLNDMTPIMWEDEERQRKILCKYAHMQLYFLELCFVKGLRIIVLFRLVHYPLHIPCLVKSNVFMQPYHNILTAGFCALHAL